MSFAASKRTSMTLAIALALTSAVAQQPAPVTLTIDTKTIVAPVSPMLYGLMTEEINHSYEGGLYAEMVSNRTFRSIWSGVENWQLIQNGNAHASISVDKTTGPSAPLPTSLKLTVSNASKGSEAGLLNPGWWGMNVVSKTQYKGSFYAKYADGFPGPVTVSLVNDDTAKVLASTTISPATADWKKYEFALTTDAVVGNANSQNHLELTVANPCTLWLQLVSLFPPTYRDRSNGNRPDLMQAMADMHPKFLRMPGGNYLEGDRIEDRFDWKKTLGPLVDRPGHQAPWTYWSTDGLGLLEFLEWCEDLKIEPVLAVYAGYSLKGAHVPVKDLQPYIQDALDEVEYVTGDVSTKWGAERARNGHPAPFPLHYIEVGNEDWLDHSGSYSDRWPPFALALRKKYPQFKLIATEPIKDPAPSTEPDVVDDHYYKSPADMFALVHHYDDMPRTGPKIFVGEWATRSGSVTPNWGDALGDAALMTSMERNSDLIVMSAYAPLLVNLSPGAMQWQTDLIGFDAENVYLSPSYTAQRMFAASLGDTRPKVEVQGLATDARFFYSATLSTDTQTLHVKVVNASTDEQSIVIKLPGLAGRDRIVALVSLQGSTYRAGDIHKGPTNHTSQGVTQQTKKIMSVKRGIFSETVPALTIQVIDISLAQ